MRHAFASSTPNPKVAGSTSRSWAWGVALLPIALLLGLASGAPSHAQVSGGTITLPATTTIHLDLELPQADGSVDHVFAGRFGGAQGACGGASRGFLNWIEADGTVRWHRGQLPAKGTCSDPGAQPLFAGFPTLDGGHVLSSDVHAAALVPGSGRIAATGEVQVAWQDPLGKVHSARGAFVGLWEPDGQLVLGHYFGRIPDGTVLPDGDCVMVCEDGDSGNGWGDGEAWGGRTLTVVGGEITVLGWYRPDPSDPSLAPLPHLWAHRFSDDLIPLWNTIDLAGPPMTPGWIVVDTAGRTFVAGAGQDDPDRADRDVILTRIASDGTVELRRIVGGDHDDEATGLAAEVDGSLRVEGFFTDQIEIAGLTLGGPGQGQKRFHAWLDPDLAWTGAGALALPQGIASPRLGVWQGGRLDLLGVPVEALQVPTLRAPAKSGENHPAIPLAYQVMEGTEHRGQLAQIDTSDNDYLRIIAGDRDTIELRVLFDPDPQDRQALYLERVRVELTTLFCYRAQILVKGMVSEDFVVAGERSLCPSDEPILEIDIPEDLSDNLGYDGSTYVDPDHRLVVAIRIAFGDPDGGKATHKNMLYASAEEDTSVDHVEVIVEY